MPGMSASQIAQKVSPGEFMSLCSKVTSNYQQKFDVLDVKREGKSVSITVELEDGKQKTVVI